MRAVEGTEGPRKGKAPPERGQRVIDWQRAVKGTRLREDKEAEEETKSCRGGRGPERDVLQSSRYLIIALIVPRLLRLPLKCSFSQKTKIAIIATFFREK